MITRHYNAKLQTTKQTLTASKHWIESTYTGTNQWPAVEAINAAVGLAMQ